MRPEIPGFRPRVIDQELFRLLDDFRGLRHKFRQSYGFDLGWEKERQVARKLPEARRLVRSQIEVFLAGLKGLKDAWETSRAEPSQEELAM